MDYYDVDQPFDDTPDYDMYEPTSAEIWTTCTWPSIQQIYKYFLPFVFWNISFRIITQASMFSFISFSVAHLTVGLKSPISRSVGKSGDFSAQLLFLIWHITFIQIKTHCISFVFVIYFFLFFSFQLKFRYRVNTFHR